MNVLRKIQTKLIDTQSRENLFLAGVEIDNFNQIARQ